MQTQSEVTKFRLVTLGVTSDDGLGDEVTM